MDENLERWFGLGFIHNGSKNKEETAKAFELVYNKIKDDFQIVKDSRFCSSIFFIIGKIGEEIKLNHVITEYIFSDFKIEFNNFYTKNLVKYTEIDLFSEATFMNDYSIHFLKKYENKIFLTRADKVNTILSGILNEIIHEQSVQAKSKVLNKFIKSELDFETEVLIEKCSDLNGLTGSVTFENEEGIVKIVHFSVKNNKQYKNTEYKN